MKIASGWCIYYITAAVGEVKAGGRKEDFMDNDDKLLSDLSEQLGFGRTVSKADRMSDMADQYKGKSDQELIDEIMKVKHSLKKNSDQFEKQMKAIKAMRSMMNGEQKARLEKLIRLLEADD
jgi:hypothetical protein